MLDPAPAYAALDPSLVRRPAVKPAPFAEIVEEPDAAPEPRWREELRFFLVCYFTALAGFLFLLG